MKKQSIYIMGLILALVPTGAQAHAQLTLHHHSSGDYWLSLIPEILLIVGAFAGILMLVRRHQKVKISHKK